MFKSKMLATLTLVFAAVALLTTMSVTRTAFASGSDDVFMDEGDGDFDSAPAPPVAQVEQKIKKENVAVQKAPEPRPASEPLESTDEIPVLTDDASAVTPAPTEDPAQPTAAQPKEKKAKKKKPSKKSAVSASNDETPAVPSEEPTHKAHGGSFVTTKDACPMMRSPASTGETMLTVKASKKIWVEDAGDGWVKAYNKSGEAGYVSKDCVL
jgi:outer membrane biosynthesis protein TonB